MPRHAAPRPNLQTHACTVAGSGHGCTIPCEACLLTQADAGGVWALPSLLLLPFMECGGLTPLYAENPPEAGSNAFVFISSKRSSALIPVASAPSSVRQPCEMKGARPPGESDEACPPRRESAIRLAFGGRDFQSRRKRSARSAFLLRCLTRATVPSDG